MNVRTVRARGLILMSVRGRGEPANLRMSTRAIARLTRLRRRRNRRTPRPMLAPALRLRICPPSQFTDAELATFRTFWNSVDTTMLQTIYIPPHLIATCSPRLPDA